MGCTNVKNKENRQNFKYRKIGGNSLKNKKKTQNWGTPSNTFIYWREIYIIVIQDFLVDLKKFSIKLMYYKKSSVIQRLFLKLIMIVSSVGQYILTLLQESGVFVLLWNDYFVWYNPAKNMTPRIRFWLESTKHWVMADMILQKEDLTNLLAFS